MEATQISDPGQRPCAYLRQDGTACPGPVEGEARLCFWHDPEARKDGPDIRERLAEWAHTGRSMAGFQLKGAHLEGVRLTRGNPRERWDLSGADLSRAHLRGASLFNIDLQGADLFKADLSGANMNHGLLANANLLGSVLDGAKMERVKWGECLVQEHNGMAAEADGRHEEARRCYDEAQEIYRTLRQAYDRVGRFDEAGHFFQREMAMKRRLLSRWSPARFWSKLAELYCGYGESPPKVIIAALIVIFMSGLLFFLIGVKGPGGPVQLAPHLGMEQNLLMLGDCVYYSVITFTTTGYGDIIPLGTSRAVAAVETCIGSFLMALFIAVFGKKMTRE
jgi:hypothetical protein